MEGLMAALVGLRHTRFLTVAGDTGKTAKDSREWLLPQFTDGEASVALFPLHAVVCGPLRGGSPGADRDPHCDRCTETTKKLRLARINPDDVMKAVVEWPLGPDHDRVRREPQ
jgi:hypothetical protein